LAGAKAETAPGRVLRSPRATSRARRARAKLTPKLSRPMIAMPAAAERNAPEPTPWMPIEEMARMSEPVDG